MPKILEFIIVLIVLNFLTWAVGGFIAWESSWLNEIGTWQGFSRFILLAFEAALIAISFWCVQPRRRRGW